MSTKRIPYPTPSYDSMKPMLFELFDKIEKEALKLYIDRAYTEWYNKPDK
jgi:hypothetical protein